MSEPATSVFLLAENRLLRETLLRILSNRTTFIVAGSAFNESAWERLSDFAPDVVLSDAPQILFGPENQALRLRASAPNARLVLVGMERDEKQFLQLVSEGVVGYTLKDATAVEIVAAIRAVARGEAICPACMSVALFQAASRGVKSASATRTPPDLALSRREQQLVPHLALGMTNKEIASKLNISDQTVKNHVHRILRKLGVRDRQMIAELWDDEAQIGGSESPGQC